ncbi:MAG: hypothetical protein JJ896_05410 [Rhodothermales bacterium]|nr:hypothetical protein [Rhodothermales bacterium]MBO6779072.1 hypothetical protein [Rhodothermales bacterium]
MRLLAACWLILPAGQTAAAQVALPGAVTAYDGTTLTQSVTVSVSAISLISVSGNVTLTIDAATAGSSPDSDVDASTVYRITVNQAGQKITGSLDSGFSAGLTVQLLLAAPSGGSASQVTLSTTPQDLVTGVSKVAESGLTLTYTATGTPSAAPNGAGQSRTVTLTLTAE